MTIEHCEREAAVLEALRGGDLGGDLRRHVDGCPVCSDAVLVEGYLAEARDATAADWQPDPAGHVWWRAERRARSEAMERATRPIAVVRQASWAVAALVAVAGAVRGWPLVRSWLERLTPPPVPALDGVAGLQIDPLLLLGTLALTLLVFGIGIAWAED